MQSGVSASLVLFAATFAPDVAVAEVITLPESQLTIDLPEDWRHAGSGDSAHHPGVRVDVLATAGAELRVHLSSAGCPRPIAAGWSRGTARLLSDEFDEVWQTSLRDTEQGCYAGRRGELVIVVSTEDPSTWDVTRSHRLADLLIEAATGPAVSAEVARARLRSHSPGSRITPALSLGVQLTTIADSDQYREASSLQEATARLEVFSGSLVVRVEGEAGRASTGALRFDTQLLIGGAVRRGTAIGSLALGGAVGGQTASDADTVAIDQDPISAVLRVPIVLEIGQRFSRLLHGSARLRLAWQLSDPDNRHGSAPSLGISDELGLESRLLIGRAGHLCLLAGLAYEEELGTGLGSVTIGIGTVPR